MILHVVIAEGGEYDFEYNGDLNESAIKEFAAFSLEKNPNFFDNYVFDSLNQTLRATAVYG